MTKIYKKNKAEFKNCVVKVANNELSAHYASLICGYTADHIRRTAKKYKIFGKAVFIHKLTGIKPATTVPKKDKKKIIELYLNEFAGYNFNFFYDWLIENTKYTYCYKTICNILTQNGIISPEARKTERKEVVHRPRARKDCEGELIQMDATPFQWFLWCGDTAYYALHGSVDDATSKVTAFYMCQNECFYGYTEMLHLINIRYSGFPSSVYTDRARIFITPENESKTLSIEEQLEGITQKQTQFQRMLNELRIKQILANSPQAKGRIERMWKTVQGRLPWYFKKYKIKTVEQANIFLREKFIDIYNKRFAKEPKLDINLYHTVNTDYNYTCSYRISRHITKAGYFRFFNCHWKIKRKHSAGLNIELCITATSIKAYYDGHFYDVELLADSIDIEQTEAPRVVKNIIHSCMFADVKKEFKVA